MRRIFTSGRVVFRTTSSSSDSLNFLMATISLVSLFLHFRTTPYAPSPTTPSTSYLFMLGCLGALHVCNGLQVLMSGAVHRPAQLPPSWAALCGLPIAKTLASTNPASLGECAQGG